MQVNYSAHCFLKCTIFQSFLYLSAKSPLHFESILKFHLVFNVIHITNPMSIACGADGKCPYVYECINRVCVHDGIFPLSVYTSFVYILLPFGLMLTNVGGLSAGSLKVPILMDLLNYPVNQATTLSYAIVTGASMANFILLIPKRHPSKDTSLVDYNIVLLLIPCVCLGSTLGVILVAIIPLLYQDIILFIVLLLFFIYFINKVRLFGKEEKVQ